MPKLELFVELALRPTKICIGFDIIRFLMDCGGLARLQQGGGGAA